MLDNLKKLMAVVVVASLLVVPSLVLAATPDDMGTDNEADSQWTPISTGEKHWYNFHYQVSQDVGEDETETDKDADEEEEQAERDKPEVLHGSDLQIWLDSEPDGAVTFSVWTPEQIRIWALGDEKVEPVGRATENKIAPGDVSWAGNFNEAGCYCVVVEYTGSGTDGAYYSIGVTGGGIDLLPVDDEGNEFDGEAKVPGVVQEAAATALGGTGPDTALAPDGEWVELPAGETTWYAFDYQGHHEFVEPEDEEEEEEAVWVDSLVQIWLDSDPDGGITFSIWTEEDVRLYALGEEVDTLGQGTEDKHAPGDISWAGNFESPGRYYVVVENKNAEPGFFLLGIEGQDVSF